MADTVNALPGRGKTYNSVDSTAISQSIGLEGRRKSFEDFGPGQGAGVKVKRSDGLCRCILVRNDAGIALLPKRAVKWKSGYRGKRVDGYCCVNYEEVAGIVDEHLPAAGVPDDELFWLQVAGPTLVDMPVAATADVASGDIMVALTAATSGAATTAGRLRPLVATSSVTDATTQVHNSVGRAMSAKSSSQTTSTVLVDLHLLKV